MNVNVSRGGALPTPFWMGLDLAVYRWDYGTVSDPLKLFAFSPISGGAMVRP